MTKKLLVTGLALMLMAGFAQAVTLQLNATVGAAMDAAGNDLPFTVAPNGAIQGAAGVYRVDYSFLISDIPAGQQGFGNMSFSVNLPAGLTVGYNALDDVTGYMGDMARFGKSTGSTNTLPMWSGNGDIGTSTTDLQFVVVELNNAAWAAAPAVDYRKTVGQLPYISNTTSGILRSNDGFVGSAWVAWDGTTNATLTTSLNQFSTIGVDLKTVLQPDGIKDASGASVQFGVPEPATMSLLALGGLAALIRRRK